MCPALVFECEEAMIAVQRILRVLRYFFQFYLELKAYRDNVDFNIVKRLKIVWNEVSRIVIFERFARVSVICFRSAPDACCTKFFFAQHPTSTLIVDANKESGRQILDTLFGASFEEINHAGAGGLWAELVRNRGFEAGGPSIPL